MLQPDAFYLVVLLWMFLEKSLVPPYLIGVYMQFFVWGT